MAVEPHHRNHSDSKSESSSDKWNNPETLAHPKRIQHNLRDAMRGYDMCTDYTSKRIDSVSTATSAPIREQHLHRTHPSQAKLLELSSRSKIWEWISHQPIACNSLPVFVSPKFNAHGKGTFFSHITSMWTAASTRVIPGSWRESNLKVKPLKPLPWQFTCQRTGSRRSNLTVKSHDNLWPDNL